MKGLIYLFKVDLTKHTLIHTHKHTHTHTHTYIYTADLMRNLEFGLYKQVAFVNRWSLNKVKTLVSINSTLESNVFTNICAVTHVYILNAHHIHLLLNRVGRVVIEGLTSIGSMSYYFPSS